MSRMTAVAAVIAFLAPGAPVSAQSWEVSGLAAYTPSAELGDHAPELSELDIAAGFTWGLQAGWHFTPRWTVEGLWTHQASALTAGTAAGAADLFTMSVRQLQGNVAYHLGSADARLRPFVFGGAGATFFSADDLESETKVSFGLGAGVKYFPWKAIGFRTHVRYKPTILDDEEAGDFCDPFGFCQASLSQFEFAGGVVVRF